LVSASQGGTAPKLTVASFDQMISLKPGDIFGRLKNLAGAAMPW
jgi:hypothetical protein